LVLTQNFQVTLNENLSLGINETKPQKCWPGLIKRYQAWLPVSEKTPVITLQEGGTPLIPINSISHRIGKNVSVYAKYDGLNPTGSFKDRGMTMAISKAKEQGCEAVICASTGNTSASAAAYAKRAGMRCFVLIPDGYVAQGKLAQALVYGAEVISIKGNFDKALNIVQSIADKYPITLVNSVNPFRLEGQKTAAFEIIEYLGEAPDWLCIPMGNAGNITAYWMGFNEYFNAGKSTKLPKMMGFQASGSAPLVLGKNIQDPQTIATAIRIGKPVNREKALMAKEKSNGGFLDVTDQEIIEAYKLLGKEEGIFAEPASAASIAGLIKRKDEVPNGATIVCVLTGNGLKDPDCAIANNDASFYSGLEANIETVAKTMGF
tara:strand:+ start:1207 stop:2337 length:1131 start_codon:yes stop_codon:yes gene_type:complete